MRLSFLKLWPIVFIFILWFAFSSPFFLHGKIPFAGDYQVTFFPPWSQYSQFAQPVKNNAMPDVIDQLYPWKHLVIADWKTGQIPLWNPYQFAGTPLLANYQSAVFSPLNLLFFLFSFKISWSLLILLQPLLAGLGMYAYARKIHLSLMASLLASIAFMFCGFLVVWMGYGTLGYAIGILPCILFGIEGYLQAQKGRYLVFIALATAFSFVSGHFQISLYTAFAACAYVLFQSTKAHKKQLIYVSGALVIGILLASPQIFPSIAFYSQSLRSQLFQRPEVIPWQYLFTVVAPDFFGNPVTRNDWFGHYAEWSSYIGVLPFLFAIFSIFSWRENRRVGFFLILAIVALLFATPSPIGGLLLFAHVPVLATSAASRIIVLLSFSLAVLSGIGLDSWRESTKEKKLLLGVISGIVLLIGWVTIVWKLNIPVERISIAKQNFYLPSLFLLFTIVVSVGAFLIRQKRLLLVICFAILCVTAFDMYRFASKWQSFSPPAEVFPDVGVTNFFKTIKNQRSLGNYGGQVSLYYQIPAVEGYDALYPEKFGEFVSYVVDGKIHPASRSVVEFPKNVSPTILDFLGIKYIVQKISDIGKPWAFPVNAYPAFDYKIVYKDSAYIVFENLFVSPRAFIAGFYKIVDEKDVLPTLFASSTNPGTTVTLEENPHIPRINSFTINDNTAKISLYTSNKVVVNTQTAIKGLLFLSDTYFPGWKAYLDGKETKILRADYTFRAVVVPPGEHTVEFRYLPDSFLFGIAASIIGVFLLAALYFFQKKSVR